MGASRFRGAGDDTRDGRSVNAAWPPADPPFFNGCVPLTPFAHPGTSQTFYPPASTVTTAPRPGAWWQTCIATKHMYPKRLARSQPLPLLMARTLLWWGLTRARRRRGCGVWRGCRASLPSYARRIARRLSLPCVLPCFHSFLPRRTALVPLLCLATHLRWAALAWSVKTRIRGRYCGPPLASGLRLE
jgi:hypothetical protein